MVYRGQFKSELGTNPMLSFSGFQCQVAHTTPLASDLVLEAQANVIEIVEP